MGEEAHWNREQARLAEALAKKDIGEFLRWPEVMTSLFVGTNMETAALWHELVPRWRELAAEPWVGQPAPFGLDPSTSGNMVRQAWHLQWLERQAGLLVGDLETVREFGGGYGCMAYLAHKAGFRGHWEIFDFPVVTRLQTHYLGELDVPFVASDWDSLEAYPADLVVGLCSISEAPWPVRELFLAACSRSGLYYFRYQDAWAGMNNCDYFSRRFPASLASMQDPITGHHLLLSQATTYPNGHIDE